ncbi:four helix bundle protein [Robertkochia sediminum]|uniref:four helix bundle protein n=1 Tax=Robertkochia sediminum TaxID=2785326 RepID=UPI00193408D8|nr:four helix bundle protein [Robertkochia sediminum]MBL7471426.1 four helix bundle protein [Robertkochia sediminum]
MHTDLDVYNRSMDLVEEIYNLTKQFPDYERYGLVSQINRAVVSIPSNIAEGAARGSTKDYCRFINIALGSASELETLLRLSERLRLANTENIIKDRLIPVQKMLYKQRVGLQRRI